MDGNRAVKQLLALEKYAHELRLAAEWREKWKILISTILSAQTKDETTIEISGRLYKRYPTVAKLACAKLADVKKTIRPVNYYKTKARHIIATAQIIAKRGIPKNLPGLLELPGVGRKVANVYLAEAEGTAAIGVDTHVARISQKMGWTRETRPHKIEKDLEKLFPKRYWNDINYIVVRFGRSVPRREEDALLKKVKTIQTYPNPRRL